MLWVLTYFIVKVIAEYILYGWDSDDEGEEKSYGRWLDT